MDAPPAPVALVFEQLMADPVCSDLIQQLRQLAGSEEQPALARLDAAQISLAAARRLGGDDAALMQNATTALALAAVFEVSVESLVGCGRSLMREKPRTTSRQLYKHLLNAVADGSVGEFAASLAREMLAEEP